MAGQHDIDFVVAWCGSDRTQTPEGAAAQRVTHFYISPCMGLPALWHDDRLSPFVRPMMSQVAVCSARHHIHYRVKVLLPAYCLL